VSSTIHEVNNTHKVPQKPFPVISIGGHLQGSHNTICCPQCQRRPDKQELFISGTAPVCLHVCLLSVYQTSLHMTRSPRASLSCNFRSGDN